MSKTTNTKENGFEKHIVDHLVNTNGYVLRTSQDYNNINCVDSELLFQFLDATQPKAVEYDFVLVSLDESKTLICPEVYYLNLGQLILFSLQQYSIT